MPAVATGQDGANLCVYACQARLPSVRFGDQMGIMATGSAPLHPEDPAVLAHLSMLQACITRMAGNSAQCKTWCLTIVSALVAFAGAVHSIGAVSFTILPIISFLMLDAAYLGNEVEFRTLFNEMCEKLRTHRYLEADLFSMGASLSWQNLTRALSSWSVYIFYYPLVALYLAAITNPTLTHYLANAR